MEERIITLVTLSYERAQIVKSILEADGIECFFEHFNLIQGAFSSGVQIKISESDMGKAMLIYESIRESEFDSIPLEDVDGKEFKILVPIDFSPYSQKAAEIAFDWACRRKGEITLFHSYFAPIISNIAFEETYPYEIGLQEVSADVQEEAEELLEKLKLNLLERYDDEPDIQVKINIKLYRGVAEDEIIDFSKIYQPTMIIMGTRGVNRKVNDLIGSVTAEIMERAKVPVFAIPEDFIYNDLDQLSNIGFMVVFDEQDNIAVNKIHHIFSSLNIRLICAHISDAGTNDADKIKIQSLQKQFQKLNFSDLMEFRIFESEDFLVGVEKFVQQENLNILAFTTFKRGLISRILNPSIAKKMLFHTNTPLLVFHT